MKPLRVAQQIGARDVVVVPDLTPAHAAEKFLCAIGAGTVQAIGFLVVDALQFRSGREARSNWPTRRQ